MRCILMRCAHVPNAAAGGKVAMRKRGWDSLSNRGALVGDQECNSGVARARELPSREKNKVKTGM